MGRRLHISTGGIVISLPGYEAGPATPEIGKAFDSNWPFTGLVIAHGFYVDPAPSNGQSEGLTDSTDPHFLAVQGLRPAYQTLLFIVRRFPGLASERIETFEGYYYNSVTVAVTRGGQRLIGTLPYLVIAA